MKKNYFSKCLLGLCLLGMTTTVIAKDLYISENGNDANSGLTANEAKATFPALLLMGLEDGDVINVSGKITVDDVVAISSVKNLVIKGTNPATDILDGNNETRIFFVEDTEGLYLRYLTIQNAKTNSGDGDSDSGGAMQIHNSMVRIDSCTFKNNETSFVEWSKGGAIFALNSELHIMGSTFDSNKGFRGGAIEIGSSSIVCEYTTFNRNETTTTTPNEDHQEARAGAISTENLQSAVFRYCTFTQNRAHAGGGVFFVNTDTQDTSFYMEGCAVVRNIAGNAGFDSHGGAFFFATGGNKFTTTIVNTTIALNSGTQAGGVVFYDGGGTETSFTLANVTMVNNYTTSNAGNGGGLRFFDNPTKINVINSILEGNYTQDDSDWSDMTIGNNPNVFIANSVIGKALIENDPDFAGTYRYNTADGIEEGEVPNYAGVTEDGIQKNSYPLKPDANGTTMADLDLLAELNILFDEANPDVLWDQKQKVRTRNYIGAVDINEDETVPDVVTPALPALPDPGPGSNIEETIADGGLIIYPNPVADYMVIQLPVAIDGQLTADLFALSGEKVKELVNESVAGVNAKPVTISGVAPGSYILKVVIEGEVITKKIVVK